MSQSADTALREAGASVAPATSSAHRPQDCRRPLYLCTRQKARVDADGPALRVRATGRSEVRYPLYRVSRVIASDRVDWSAAALGACLQSGIPIIIVTGNGAPIGLVQPAHVLPSRLADDVDELLDRPDWQEIYGNWLRATRMRVLAGWRRERETTGDPLAPGEFTGMVRKYVYGCVNANLFEAETGVWRSALTGLAATALRRHGLQPRHWGAGGEGLDLLGDLSRVLELRLRLEVRGGMEHALDGEALALRVFHALSGKLEAECECILQTLARRVRQVLTEWR